MQLCTLGVGDRCRRTTLPRAFAGAKSDAVVLAVPGDELANADFPFLGETSQDRYGQASGMAFFLCKQLCKQMGGSLEILAKPDIGTRHSIQLPLAVEPRPEEEEEKLLKALKCQIWLSE